MLCQYFGHYGFRPEIVRREVLIAVLFKYLPEHIYYKSLLLSQYKWRIHRFKMASDKQQLSFQGAEIKKLGVKKLVSLDKEYEIVIRTMDQSIMLLDAYSSDVTFKVTVEPEL